MNRNNQDSIEGDSAMKTDGVAEVQTDERTEILRQNIVKSKLAFIAQKNRVLYELCEDGSDVQSMQEAIEMMLDSQQTVLSEISELSQVYSDAKELKKLQMLSDDMETIYRESHQAQDTACKVIQGLCIEGKIGSLHHGLEFKEKQREENSTANIKLQTEVTMLHRKIAELESRICDDETLHNQGPSLCDTSLNVGKDLWNQLEKVTIPIFSGDKGTYEGWREAFNACVDQAPVSAVYKLLQLKKYLSDEPLQLVSRLGHSARAYETAKEKLNRKYGGKRRQTAMYLQQLEKFNPLKDGDSRSFEAFADLLETAVFTLKESGRVEELGNGTLYSTLLKKLTDKQMVDFLRWSAEKEIEESVESLTQWSLRESEFRVISAETREGFGGGSSQKTFFIADQIDDIDFNRKAELRCAYCRKDHMVANCKEFSSLSYSERWDAAKANGLCFRCLVAKHIGRNCKGGVVCGIQGCQSSHNKLLHRMQQKYSDEMGKRSDECSFRTIPVILKNGDTQVKVNALLDSASSKSFINDSIARKLQLTGNQKTVHVNVLNGGKQKIDSSTVAVGLQSIDKTVNRYMMVYTASNVTGNLHAVDWNHKAKEWSHLKDIPFPELTGNCQVDMLIGMDHPDLHFSRCDVRGKRGEPSARQTPLGWTCVSPPTRN